MMASNENKKKLTDFEKARLIYTGELLLFAVIFIVLGILFLVQVIPVSDWKRILFTYLTLAGGAWLTADFIWACASKKRRKRISMIDKILVFPVGLALIAFDVYALVMGIVHASDLSDEFIMLYRLVIGVDMLYLSTVYIFEAIYHWFKPVPGLLVEPQVEKPVDSGVTVDAKEDSSKEVKPEEHNDSSKDQNK